MESQREAGLMDVPNVVLFVGEDGNEGKDAETFKALTVLCNGGFSTVKGLKAIRSYISAD
ncbi:hypothetical protein EGM51_12035 [Verrucomicrobia bacterium S94]|nr:hypothetical protein EGM51_12035 [Verrucomicrobia bacterium S94]